MFRQFTLHIGSMSIYLIFYEWQRVYPFDDTLNRFIKHFSSNMLLRVLRLSFLLFTQI